MKNTHTHTSKGFCFFVSSNVLHSRVAVVAPFFFTRNPSHLPPGFSSSSFPRVLVVSLLSVLLLTLLGAISASREIYPLLFNTRLSVSLGETPYLLGSSIGKRFHVHIHFAAVWIVDYTSCLQVDDANRVFRCVINKYRELMNSCALVIWYLMLMLMVHSFRGAGACFVGILHCLVDC